MSSDQSSGCESLLPPSRSEWENACRTIENLERALTKVRATDPTHSAVNGHLDRWWKNVTDLIDAALAGQEIAK